MGCATGLVKNLVFLFNFLCSIVGLVLIVLGSIAVAGIHQIDSATKQNYTIVPAFILSVGIVIFVISFLGCCGVCQRSQCMLITYAAILILLFVIQFSLGIYGYVQISNDETNAKKEVRDQLANYFKDYTKNKDVQEFFDIFQVELKCCGVDGPTDYVNPHLLIDPRVKFPASCCGLKGDQQCNKPYTDGCSNKLFDLLIHSLKVVSYVALGVCATEIVAALFAICLVNSYRNEARRGS